LKQARAAFSLLNPDEVQSRGLHPVTFGLVASTEYGYGELEDFLLPSDTPALQRAVSMSQVHRAGERNVPSKVDIVLYEPGIACNADAYTLNRNHPELTIERILEEHEELALPLARQFPVFRKAVVEDIIKSVARENALFAIATALPDVVPSLVEIPWAFGEFASDTAFLTGNQVRMAFQISVACGREAGISRQKAEILSIAAGAFGWRALARELAGKIPMGGGLIPKGAIAYAGTYAVGKGLEYVYHLNSPYPKDLGRATYKAALDKGKQVASSIYEGMKSKA